MKQITIGNAYAVRCVQELESIAHDTGNVDITVEDRRAHATYHLTFFTLDNVGELIAHHRQTGEGGTYFWASNMILVEDLSVAVILATIADLVAQDRLRIIGAWPGDPGVPATQNRGRSS